MTAHDLARHVEPITVRWGDMDSMGHVNNAKYFTYCESARMSYFAAVRMQDHREDEQHGPALVAATLNFRRQVHYPAELEVATRVREIGRSSFKMEYEISRTGREASAGNSRPPSRTGSNLTEASLYISQNLFGAFGMFAKGSLPSRRAPRIWTARILSTSWRNPVKPSDSRARVAMSYSKHCAMSHSPRGKTTTWILDSLLGFEASGRMRRSLENSFFQGT
jgi:acyl-CoA thioester hydrolase